MPLKKGRFSFLIYLVFWCVCFSVFNQFAHHLDTTCHAFVRLKKKCPPSSVRYKIKSNNSQIKIAAIDDNKCLIHPSTSQCSKILFAFMSLFPRLFMYTISFLCFFSFKIFLQWRTSHFFTVVVSFGMN